MENKVIGLTTLPTGSWVQIDRVAMEKWAKLTIESPRASSVMMTIVSNVGRHNALIASHANLAKASRCSVATLKRAIKTLVTQNYLEIRQIGQVGTSNAYIVNDRVAWTGKRDGIRYSLFSATVLVSDDDQPDREQIDNLLQLEKIPAMFAGEQQLFVGEGLPPPTQPPLSGLEPDLPARIKEQETAG